MNRIFKLSAAALAGLMVFASCQQTPELRLTDVGPEVTVESCTESTYMGAEISFSVSVKDDDFDLSTLEASLYYDETQVNNISIRTKEDGLYEGSIQAPLMKEIPDGTASIVFTAQNVGMGCTYDTLYVKLKRPDFEALTLKAEDGQTYTMSKVVNDSEDTSDDYTYTLSGEFPEVLKGVLVSPAINDEGEVITIGWNGSALDASNENPVSFSAGLAGYYTISVDLLNLTASPLKTSNVVSIKQLKQGQVMDFGSVVDMNNWSLDYDFFEVDKEFTEAKFRAVDGYYKMSYDVEAMSIRVEPVDAAGNLLSLAEDGSGVPWVIGSNFGKPEIGPSWNTEDGAYAMAQVSDNVYQFTLTAPGQFALSGGEIKFFHQKGWGGEFVKEDYADVQLGSAFTMTDTGNIKVSSISAGKSYKFILDLTGGVKAAKLSYEEVIVPVNMLDIKVNETSALKMSKTVYKVTSMWISKDDAVVFGGEDIKDVGALYVDPDHFSVGGEEETCPECGQVIPVTGDLKFNAVDGFYSFEIDLANKYVTVRRVKEDGSAATYVDERAITFMGWGVAHPVMTNQLAWDSGALITLAEVEDGVYQFTGIAVEETDGTTLGGRWRYDYLSAKFFGQAGWGVEQASDLNLTSEAKKYIQQSAGSNIEMADGVELELGATYVMTVTECTDLIDNKFNCTVDFRKL